MFLRVQEGVSTIRKTIFDAARLSFAKTVHYIVMVREDTSYIVLRTFIKIAPSAFENALLVYARPTDMIHRYHELKIARRRRENFGVLALQYLNDLVIFTPQKPSKTVKN